MTSVCQKKSSAAIQIIHADQISVENLIILWKMIDRAKKLKQHIFKLMGIYVFFLNWPDAYYCISDYKHDPKVTRSVVESLRPCACVHMCVCVCVCVFISSQHKGFSWLKKTINVMPDIKSAMLCWGNSYVPSTLVAMS